MIKLLVLLLILILSASTAAQDTPIVRFGNSASLNPSISADGRYIAFASDASNLVSDDTNDSTDIFVHDRDTSTTTRVSVASDGTQGNSYSRQSHISANGRFVTFESEASNLVPDDTNNQPDIFVHNLDTGETVRVSVASDGTEAASSSFDPSISADGQVVAFWSNAYNLIPEDSNDIRDSFVHFLDTGETVRVNIASDGTESNNETYETIISANGQFALFWSRSDILVEDDTNQTDDIFLHDLQTRETTRVNVASDGTEANDYTFEYFSVSADGRFVAFQSRATNFSPDHNDDRNDIFVRDRETGETILITDIDECSVDFCFGSSTPSISDDGRYIAFYSDVTGFVEDDTNETTDVFVYDREGETYTRVSINSNGREFVEGAYEPVISGNGRYVVFETGAPLQRGDLNLTTDVYLHDLETRETTLISVANPPQ
jgi:Tol biopolymer transport system component